MKQYSIIYYLRNDINLLVDSLRKRFIDVNLVYRARKLDEDIRVLRREVDSLKAEKNRLTKALPKASPEERQRLINRAKELDEVISIKSQRLKSLEDEFNRVLNEIPNIVSDDVPVAEDESGNKILRYWGRPKVMERLLDSFIESTRGFDIDYELIDYEVIPHADWSEDSGLVDVLRAGKTAGSRFYYMFSDLVILDIALTAYAIDYLVRRGFIPVETPHMIRREVMEGAAFFEAFQDTLYKTCDEELYLIATSEQSLAGLYYNEVLEESELPVKLAGWSPCYRREAGAHGRDMKGIFRVHQFNKVEQFIFSHPEESKKYHEELIRNAEELYQGLGLPYRVVVIASGEMNRLAIKQYDLEVWMPSQGVYRELVSASNCTDWQAYRLNIRFTDKRGHPIKGYVHTLNGTAIAIQRTLTAIIENYQDSDGRVEIPKVLHRYLSTFGFGDKKYIEPIELPGGKP